MFNDPKLLAQSALELLQIADEHELSPNLSAAIELGAATLCNHVWDWHDKANRAPQGRETFKQQYPEWDALRLVSNGTKHAMPIVAEGAIRRQIKWEDDDFWCSSHQRDTLFVEVGGRQRSVSALVRQFAASYIGKP